MGKVTRDRPRACDSDPPAPPFSPGQQSGRAAGGQHRIPASVCVAAGGREEGPGGRPTPTTQPTRFLLQTSAKPWGFAFPS